MSNPTAVAALTLGVGGTLAVAPQASSLLSDGSAFPELLCGADCGGAARRGWLEEAAGGIQIVASDDEFVIPMTGSRTYYDQDVSSDVGAINRQAVEFALQARRDLSRGKDVLSLINSDSNTVIEQFPLTDPDATDVTKTFRDGDTRVVEMRIDGAPVLITNAGTGGETIVLWKDGTNFTGVSGSGVGISLTKANEYAREAYAKLYPM